MAIKVQEIRLYVVVLLLLPDILAEFRSERDLVPFEKGSGSVTLEVPPGSVGGVVIFSERWNSFACIIVDVDSVIAVPIVGEPPKRLPGSERVVILGVDVSASIRRLVPRIVENRAEGGGGNVFGPRGSDNMDVEIMVDDVAKYAVGLVAVGIFSDPVVCGRAVELRKEELFVPVAVIESAGEQGFESVVKTVAVAYPGFVGIPAPRFAGKFECTQIAA